MNKGIAYFVSHRSLWKPLTSKLAPTISLGLGVTTFMFIFTYVPQMAVMAFTSGPLAALTAAVLVLSESSTLFTILSKTFLIEDALVDTFDGVLVSKNTTNLVSGGRQIKAGSDPIAKLGKLVKKPFAKFTPTAIIRYFIYLPLNFIPVVGTVIFIILQGRRAGPAAHSRYFQLKEWNSSQRQKHIEQHKGAYTRSEMIDSYRYYHANRLQFWSCCGIARARPCSIYHLCIHQYSRSSIMGCRHGEG